MEAVVEICKILMENNFLTVAFIIGAVSVIIAVIGRVPGATLGGELPSRRSITLGLFGAFLIVFALGGFIVTVIWSPRTETRLPLTITPTLATQAPLTITPTDTSTATPTDTPMPTTFVIPTPTTVVSYENKIAFKSDRDGGETIYIMNPDGSDQARLDDERAYYTAAKLDWISPDGKYQLMVQDNDGNWNIYLDDGVHVPPLRLTANYADDYDPAWSPSGEHIAYVSLQTGTADIWVMDSDGQNKVRLTKEQRWNKHPSWSPSGDQIVFWSDRQDERQQIWVMNDDGTDQRNISNNDYNDWDPV